MSNTPLAARLYGYNSLVQNNKWIEFCTLLITTFFIYRLEPSAKSRVQVSTQSVDLYAAAMAMENSPIPYTPPTPPPTKPNNMPLLYYGLVVVGTAALVLAIYNLIILRWCSHSQTDPPRQSMAAPSRFDAAAAASRQSSDNPNVHLISSFKYKKGGSPRDQEANNTGYECAVCLSFFEEEEEIRQLPRCKHCFHASCIDMWLYSHLDCPLCRSPVDPPFLNRVLATTTRQAGNSGEGLLILL